MNSHTSSKHRSLRLDGLPRQHRSEFDSAPAVARRRAGRPAQAAPGEQTLRCVACDRHKPPRLFNVRSDGAGRGYASSCKACQSAYLKAHYQKSPAAYLRNSARQRAREWGLPFDLEIGDIVVPSHCPVLGLALVRGQGVAIDSSPSLDRIVPALGYVRGNVVVVCKRANQLKSDAAAGELRRLAQFYTALEGGAHAPLPVPAYVCALMPQPD